MSNEKDTRKLLEFQGTLEQRIKELETEMSDLKTALQVIESMIVSQGFRTISPTEPAKPRKPEPPKKVEPPRKTEPPPPVEPEPKEEEPPFEEEGEFVDPGLEGVSITAKNGTVLGRMYVEGRKLSFIPQADYNFTTDIPPFKSFFIERVLENMRITDRERVTNGELDPGEALTFTVEEEGNVLKEINVTNYGGERRLREINSSLRWTFDKMYDKTRE